MEITEQEKEIIQNILKRSETECPECVLWDETAKMYGKRGMCQKCFDKSCVNVELPYMPKS